MGGADFREALVSQQIPLSLNPLIGDQDPAVHDVGHLLYRSLLRLDGSGYPRPDLAKSYAVSGDGLTYQVTLAAGQRWSSGAAITPTDVAATVAFVQTSPAVDPRLGALVHGVKLSVTGGDIGFTLPSPRASFAATLTQIPILPLGAMRPAQLLAVAAHPSRPLATSGPYLVTRADDSGIDLARNPFAAPRPRLAHIRFDFYTTFPAAASAFNSGGADAVLATTPQQRASLLRRSGSVAHDITTFQFVDLLFNERVPGLNDAVVRRAIATAVNRSAIVRGALETRGGVPQVGPVSQGLAWAAGAATPEAASPSVASAALQQAGWIAGPPPVRTRGGVALDYTLTVPDVAPLPTVGAELANQLALIGIRIRVAPVPADQFMSPDVAQHNFQLALGDWDNGPDPDVSVFWRSNATPPHGFNVAGASADPFLDQALDVLASATDAQARVAAAASVSRDLATDVPAVFLYTPTVAYVLHTSLAATPVAATGGTGARFDDIAGWHH